MKPNLFLHSYKICHLKYTTPKFEKSRTKTGDSMSAESWVVLPRNMAFRSHSKITTACDVSLGTQTSNPIWQKERKRRQEEGDIALVGPLTVQVVKNTRKKGF